MKRQSWFPILILVVDKIIWCEHNIDVPSGVGFYVLETRVQSEDYP